MLTCCTLCNSSFVTWPLSLIACMCMVDTQESAQAVTGPLLDALDSDYDIPCDGTVRRPINFAPVCCICV